MVLDENSRKKFNYFVCYSNKSLINLKSITDLHRYGCFKENICFWLVWGSEYADPLFLSRHVIIMISRLSICSAIQADKKPWPDENKWPHIWNQQLQIGWKQNFFNLYGLVEGKGAATNIRNIVIRKSRITEFETQWGCHLWTALKSRESPKTT